MNITLNDIKPLIEKQITCISMFDPNDKDWESVAKNTRNTISCLVYPLKDMHIIYDYNVTYSVELKYDDSKKDGWTSAKITFVIGLKTNSTELEFNRDWISVLTLSN